VSRRDEAFLQLVYALQLGLMEALDEPPHPGAATDPSVT
jgi:hypothetical protein